jgi:hypothetical protein
LWINNITSTDKNERSTREYRVIFLFLDLSYYRKSLNFLFHFPYHGLYTSYARM